MSGYMAVNGSRFCFRARRFHRCPGLTGLCWPHSLSGFALFPVPFRYGSITFDLEDAMNPHPYLRAYMAGSAVPTMLLLVVLGGFLIARYTFHIPIPIERAIVFPMALVPNIFGAWNIFYLW